MKPHKLKSYLFGLFALFLCISVTQAFELGRCKIKIKNGPVLRFAWLYYQNSSAERELTSTLPMLKFQQNAKINGVVREVIICGGNTHTCEIHPNARVQNANETTTIINGIFLGNTNLVKMVNKEDRVSFELKKDGTWKYALKINGANPSNDIDQEGDITSKPGETNQCGIIPYPNKDVSLKVALKYVNNSAQDLANYKHGDCDNGRSCTLPPEIIKFPTRH